MGKRGREAHVARGAATPRRPDDVDESDGAQAVAAIRTQARGAARACACATLLLLAESARETETDSDPRYQSRCQHGARDIIHDH